MAFENDGNLLTDKRNSGTSTSWSTDTDWNNAQQISDITIDGNTLKLLETLTVVDSWEDGDRSEYTDDSSWDGGSHSASTNQSFDGSWAADVQTNGTVFASGSTSGLPAYPSAGDTITYRLYFPNTDDNAAYLYYGTQNESGANSSSYRVTVRNQDDSLQLDNRNGGGTIASTNTSNIPSSQWLRLVVEWGTGGGHTVTLYNESGSQLGSMSGTDSSMSSGGIGVGLNNRNTNNSRYYVDYITYE